MEPLPTPTHKSPGVDLESSWQRRAEQERNREESKLRELEKMKRKFFAEGDGFRLLTEEERWTWATEQYRRDEVRHFRELTPQELSSLPMEEWRLCKKIEARIDSWRLDQELMVDDDVVDKANGGQG